MKKEIIVKKIDWVATLNQILKGESHRFEVGAKDIFNIRQVACRLKQRNGKVFTTNTLDNGIEVRRTA